MEFSVGSSTTQVHVSNTEVTDAVAVNGSENEQNALRTIPPLPAVGAAIASAVLEEIAGDDRLLQKLLDMMEQAAPSQHARYLTQSDWGEVQSALKESTSNSGGFNLFDFLAKVIEQSGKLDTQTRQLLPLICTLGTVAYALNKASAILTAQSTLHDGKVQLGAALNQGRTSTGSYIAKQDLSAIKKHVESPAETLTGMQSTIEAVLGKWLGDSGEQVQTLMEKLTSVIDDMMQLDVADRQWAIGEQKNLIGYLSKFNLDLAANMQAFGPRR